MRARAAIALGVVATLAACTSGDDGGTAQQDDHPWSDDVTLVSALSPFDACDDMLEYITEHALRMVGPWGLDGGGPWPVDGFAREEAAAGDMDDAGGAEAAAPSLTEGVDYSGTNVQEAGVDEPDRVKTDGRLLYLLRSDELVIVDVSGDDPELLSTTPLDSWGSSLLRSGDRLLVFGETDGQMSRGGFADDDMGWFHGTRLALYDVSDPAAPSQVATLDMDGWVISARLVDGAARVVVNATNTPQFEMPGNRGIRSERDATERNRDIIRNSVAEDWLPYFVHTAGSATDEGVLLPCEQVNHPAQFSGLGTTSVLTFDLDGDLSPGAAATGVLASGNTVYASPERLYVATNRWVDWGALSDTAIREVNRDYSTDLHAFDISSADRARYLGSGTVRGHVLNQWAMSVHDGVLRVATTEGAARWTWGEDEALSESFVTTFAERDGALAQLGQVGGLGLDERIYAVRFMGDVGYVVTFRETDPLYTVDLSDPAKPAVLGELKIMGYSAYLHPIGEDLLLGVGQDADERGRVEGLQLSLFDIADLADPQRIHQVTIEEAHSSAEWDHHAFLHWPATGITVVPFELWRWDPESETEDVDSGALAYTLDRESGFTDLGRLTHLPDDVDETHPRFWDIAWRTSIQRSIVIGDTLYTVSDLGVKASDVETLADRGWLGLPAR